MVMRRLVLVHGHLMWLICYNGMLEKLQQLKTEENASEVFVELPSNHFFEIVNMLLSK